MDWAGVLGGVGAATALLNAATGNPPLATKLGGWIAVVGSLSVFGATYAQDVAKRTQTLLDAIDAAIGDPTQLRLGIDITAQCSGNFGYCRVTITNLDTGASQSLDVLKDIGGVLFGAFDAGSKWEPGRLYGALDE